MTGLRADIAFVIPTYNRAALLRETILSVLAQTLRPAEIIVVDNGSEPDTQAMLREFADDVVSLRVPPEGVQRARNAGIEHARATWIAFLDDDDLLLPGYVATAAEIIADGRADVIGADHVKFEAGRLDPETNFSAAKPGYWTGIARPEPGRAWSFVGGFPLDRLLSRIPIYPSTMMIRRDLARAIGGFDARVRHIATEDIEFLVRALRAGRLALIWEPMVHYRRHPQGVSFGLPRARISRLQVFEWIRANNPDLPAPFVAALDEDLPRRRKIALDTAYEHGWYDIVRSLAPRLGRGDWTRRRRLRRAIAALPAALACPAARLLRRHT